jgi:hypothetical protein
MHRLRAETCTFDAMRGRPLLLLGAGLAVAALTAPAAHAADGGLSGSSLVRQITVQPSGITSKAVTCTGGSFVLNAATFRLPHGVKALGSIPSSNRRRWRFRFRSDSTQTRHVKVSLRCGTLITPSGLHNATLRRSISTGNDNPVPAGGSARVKVNCPSGQTATGYGLAGRTGSLRLFKAGFTSTGMTFRVVNTGTDAELADLHVRCVGKRGRGLTPAGARRSFDLGFYLRAFANGARPGSRTITHRCRVGDFSLAAGFAADRTKLSVLAAYAAGRRVARFAFLNSTASRVGVRTSVACVTQ